MALILFPHTAQYPRCPTLRLASVLPPPPVFLPGIGLVNTRYLTGVVVSFDDSILGMLLLVSHRVGCMVLTILQGRFGVVFR